MTVEQQQQLAAQIEQLSDYLKQWSEPIAQGHQLTPEQMAEYNQYQQQVLFLCLFVIPFSFFFSVRPFLFF